MVASVVRPVALFGYAAWTTYQSALRHADEQLAANLDIISEQANKVFQTVDLSFVSISAIVGNLSEATIRAQEQTLHLQLRVLDSSLNSIAPIGIVVKDGKTRVTS